MPTRRSQATTTTTTVPADQPVNGESRHSKKRGSRNDTKDDSETDEADQETATSSKKKSKKNTESSDVASIEEAPATFIGKKFIVMGDFDVGKFKVESEIQRLGGEVVSNVLKSLNYCVYGRPAKTDYGGVSGPGSKKFKECKKLKNCTMIDEGAFVELVKQIDAIKEGGDGEKTGDEGQSNDEESALFVALLREIIALLNINAEDLKPVTEDQIQVLEAEMQLPLPSYLKALLKISDGISVGPHLYPSLADMKELFFYNTYFPTIFRMNRWLPYYDIDYDFCWEVIDTRGGGTILYFDLESRLFRQYGRSGTLLDRLTLFRDFLGTLDQPQGTVDYNAFKAYENSKGFGYIAMPSAQQKKFDFAYRKAERENA